MYFRIIYFIVNKELGINNKKIKHFQIRLNPSIIIRVGQIHSGYIDLGSKGEPGSTLTLTLASCPHPGSTLTLAISLTLASMSSPKLNLTCTAY
jgi:hypothetical protein